MGVNISEVGLNGLFTEDSSEKLSEESKLFAEHSFIEEDV